MSYKKRQRAPALLLVLLLILTMFGSLPVTARAAEDTEPLPTVKATTSSSITLAWESIPGVFAYHIYRGETEDGDYTLIGTNYDQKNPSFTDVKCEHDVGYYYRLSTVCFQGLKLKESELSSPVHAVAVESETVPDQSSGLIAPMASGSEILPFDDKSYESAPAIKNGILTSVEPTGPTSIEVSWNAMDGAVKYHVCRSISLMGDYQVLGETSATSFTDETCLPGTTYYYSLGAEREDGLILKDVPMPMSAKTLNMISISGTAAPTATVSPQPDNESAAPKDTPTPSPVLKPTTAPTPTPASTPEVTSSGKVTSTPTPTPKPSSGSSNKPSASSSPEWSSKPPVSPSSKPSATATPRPATSAPVAKPTSAPNAPNPASRLKAAAKGSDAVDLTWVKSNDAEYYAIYRSADTHGNFSKIATVDGKDTKYTDSGLSTDIAYCYYVTAEKAGLESLPTDTVDVRLGSSMKVKAKKTGDTGNIGVSVGWAPIPDAASYDIYRSNGNSEFVKIGTAGPGTTSWLDTMLEPSSTYQYKITSNNGTAGVAEVTTAKQSISVLALSLGTTGNNRSITLMWNKVPGASRYAVYRRTLNGEYKQVIVSDGNIWADTDVQPFTVYIYKVISDNGIEGKATALSLW